jgi:hypothetical protein
MKSSSNFLSISFSLYVIIAIKARSGADLPRHKDDTDRLHGAIFIEEE